MPFWPFRKRKAKPVRGHATKPVEQTRWAVCSGRHTRNPVKAVGEWFTRRFNLFKHYERAGQLTKEFFAQHPNMRENPKLITEEVLERFAALKDAKMGNPQPPR